MWDVFKEIHLMVEGNVVEQDQMLMNLAHIPDMRHDRQLELPCHHAHGKKLAYAGEPRAVCLHKVHTAIEEIVFEQNSVRNVLTGGNTNRSDCAAEFYVCVDIVRMRGLFNPKRLE